MGRGDSLLEIVQGLLERTYRIRAGLLEAGEFVIGDAAYRRLYQGAEFVFTGSPAGSGARTVVRETPVGLRASVYYPDALIRCLETHPPQCGLCDDNVDAFATLVEELDHLLCIAERAEQDRPLSLFELELHANVSKHLVLARFLTSSGRPLDARKRLWLRHHLFDTGSFCEEEPAVRSRYEDATRWAVRLLDALPRFRPEDRLAKLRRFHTATVSGKLELIGRVAC